MQLNPKIYVLSFLLLSRISLDLPFLGLLKQKKQNGSKDKTALSERCLRTSLPDRKDPLPDDKLLTSTPRFFCTQSASSCPKSVFPKPFKVPKLKRKLEEEEPGTKLTDDAMNEVFSSPNIPSEDKTSKVVQGNGFRDLSLRVQVTRKAFLSKFRKRANQGSSSSSGLSSNSTKPDVCMMVDVNSCDTNEDICSKTCDGISFCKHKIHVIPGKEALNVETTWMRPSPQLTTVISENSPSLCVDVSSWNESYTSSSFFCGIFPPKKLGRMDGFPKPVIEDCRG